MTRTHKTLAILLSLNSIMPGSAKESETSTFRTFEFRAVSGNPNADGETDFKGKTTVLTTDERVAFLTAYADYASAWFGAPGLDKLAVSEDEVSTLLAKLKPTPLPRVRRAIRLDGDWKQIGVAEHPSPAGERPWRNRAGVRLEEGALVLPAGTTEILDLGRSTGWRYDLTWTAKVEGAGASWNFSGVSVPAEARPPADGREHEYRLQADLTESRAFLSMDGRRVAAFAFRHAAEAPTNFSVVATGPVALSKLTFIDFKQEKDISRPYVAVVLADDDFRTKPSLENWAAPGYDDARWAGASLPCVHGGFREAGEDLYLRRTVDVPAFTRAWLDIEALDPSGEIHINGQLVAAIPTRTPIRLEVTKFLKPGKNLLAFKVRHNEVTNLSHHSNFDKAVGWFAGRTTLHLLSSPVGVSEFLASTASLDPTKKSAEQHHKVTIDNAGDTPFTGGLRVDYRRWFPEESDRTVATNTVPVTVPAHTSIVVEVPVTITDAEAWSPDRPALYSASATLSDKAGKPVDDTVTSTGVRTIAQRDGKLFLNGKEILLIGAQTMGFRVVPHMENAAKYNRCAPIGTLASEMLAIRNMGGNLLRVHNHAAKTTPDGINDPRIAEIADQLGLALFWCPPSWLREGDERLVDTANLATYMRQVYNHPSIINWELGNHPNEFKRDDGPERTHAYVKRVVGAVLKEDTSRLITPTTFWGHTHYANDLGTIDWKKRPITPVPEYTHPLVTRGSQDAPTGYGAEWSALRGWPWKGSIGADCLQNKIRPWFNFEHEESAGQPNWNLSEGWPWHKLRSYEKPYEGGSIGRTLGFDEWRASQAWQAFGAYESMRKQIQYGVVGFSWCTLEGGANSGTYEKPLLDNTGHAKLAWYVHKPLTQEIFAGSDDVDTVYGPGDTIRPVIFNMGPARHVELRVTVKTPDGKVVDEKVFPDVAVEAGRSLTKPAPFRPKLPASGFCAVEYTIITPNK